MSLRFALALLSLVLMAHPAIATPLRHQPSSVLHKDEITPKYDGVLITRIVPGHSGLEGGLRRGDIVTTYAGKAISSLQKLQELVKANSPGKSSEATEKVDVAYLRGEKFLIAKLNPGLLGINGFHVVGGKPLQLRPPATELSWDFEALKEGPLDQWYNFYFKGVGKVGFEHVRMELKDGGVTVTVTLGFGNKKWGSKFTVVESRLGIEPELKMQEYTYRELTEDVSVRARVESEAGKPGQWLVSLREKEQVRSEQIPSRADHIASFAGTWLPQFMPAKKDTCFHYLAIDEFAGAEGLPTALVARGTEDIEVAGKKVRADHYEQIAVSEKLADIWRDPSGKIVKIDFIGASVASTTKEDALKELSEELTLLAKQKYASR